MNASSSTLSSLDVSSPLTQAARNKAALGAVFDELAKGNGRPFVDLMAEDFTWTAPGTSTWSGTWRGKAMVRKELFGQLFERFADTYTNTALRMIAEDDMVVVECRGKVNTKSGKSYNNTYCFVCRLRDGQLCELTEYMDTELAAKVLGLPSPSTPAGAGERA